jgi:hypothetical protein
MGNGKGIFRKMWLFLAVIPFVVCSPGIAQEPKKENKERVIVDLVQQKNGCADCHQGKMKTPDGKEKDLTLASELKNLPKHPQLAADATIKTCLPCHKEGVRRTTFINKLHDIHMNSPIYIGMFKQTCSGCHDMKHIKGL